MKLVVTNPSPRCTNYHKKPFDGFGTQAKEFLGMHLPFTKELRMIEEVQRVAGDVNYLTINHLQLLLTVYDMETAEGLEAQQLAAVTGHHKSTVNRIIHSLGAKRGRGNDKSKGLGLLEVRTDENDSRIRRIHITAYGKRLKKLLLEVAGKDDEEAKQMATHMQAVMFESKANVMEAEASTKAHVTMKAEGIVAGKGEVGEATIKVTGQDAEMRHETPETSFPKVQASLERAIRTAATKGLKTIKYRGKEVPLIERKQAQKMMIDGELYRTLEFGIWAYHLDPVAADFGKVPSYFQCDLSNREMHDYAQQVLDRINNAGTDVNEGLEDVGKRLNNHQRKWVVNFIVRGLGELREDAIREAEFQLSAAEADNATASSLAKKSETLIEMSQSARNDMEENGLHHAGMKAMTDAVSKQNEAQQKIDAGRAARDKAAKMAEVQKQLSQAMAMMQELKDEE